MATVAVLYLLYRRLIQTGLRYNNFLVLKTFFHWILNGILTAIGWLIWKHFAEKYLWYFGHIFSTVGDTDTCLESLINIWLSLWYQLAWYQHMYIFTKFSHPIPLALMMQLQKMYIDGIPYKWSIYELFIFTFFFLLWLGKQCKGETHIAPFKLYGISLFFGPLYLPTATSTNYQLQYDMLVYLTFNK